MLLVYLNVLIHLLDVTHEWIIVRLFTSGDSSAHSIGQKVTG